jgi:hypothetical protein
MLSIPAGEPVRAELEATRMNLSRRSILLIIAIVCFGLSAVGIGFTGFSLTAVGLAAFAGAFLVEGRGLKLG